MESKCWFSTLLRCSHNLCSEHWNKSPSLSKLKYFKFRWTKIQVYKVLGRFLLSSWSRSPNNNPEFIKFFWDIQKIQKKQKKIFAVFWSQGQLLEIHLLESRLLDTFFRNLDCSTEKSRLLESGLTWFEQLNKLKKLLEMCKKAMSSRKISNYENVNCSNCICSTINFKNTDYLIDYRTRAAAKL
jgi:hypothetical protein